MCFYPAPNTLISHIPCLKIHTAQGHDYALLLSDCSDSICANPSVDFFCNISCRSLWFIVVLAYHHHCDRVLHSLWNDLSIPSFELSRGRRTRTTSCHQSANYSLFELINSRPSGQCTFSLVSQYLTQYRPSEGSIGEKTPHTKSPPC